MDDFRELMKINEVKLQKIRKMIPDDKGNYKKVTKQICMDDDGKPALNYEKKDGKCKKMSPADIVKNKKTAIKREKAKKKNASKLKMRAKKLARKRQSLGLDESNPTIGLGTLFHGFKENCTIIYIDDMYEVHDDRGGYVEFGQDDEEFNDFRDVFNKATKITYEDYIQRYSNQHNRMYKDDDWDADMVIIKADGIKKLIKHIKNRLRIGRW